MTEILQITDEESLEEMFQYPKAIIYKHSTRCPISSMARKAVEKFARTNASGIVIGIVDVIGKRTISQEIAMKTGITHESPQVIFLENGSAQWSKSHWDITVKSLNDELGSE